MLTGELRNRIDGIWTQLWTEGSTNPLTNIEQITYLIFMKELDANEQRREEDAQLLGIPYTGVFGADQARYRWHVFKNLGSAQEMFTLMQEEIFPFIKHLQGDQQDTAFSTYMRDATFQINKPATLQRVVAIIDELPTEDSDTTGDIYEYLLSKLATSGTNGQFRTPRHIIKMMVELMAPTPMDRLIDPAMGTAGFLVAASEFIREHYQQTLTPDEWDHYHHDAFHGHDTDNTMLRIGAMNMMLHGVENPQISYADSLSEEYTERDAYSLVLANPPFKGSLDYEGTANDLLAVAKTKKTELLFLVLVIQLLKAGGRAAVIVPDGVLFGASRAHKAIRQEIIDNHRLEAVISMPSGVFKPYAGVSTGILIFTKTEIGGTDQVWFYDMEADGYSLDDKRSPIEANDIPDIIARFKDRDGEQERERTAKSFMVPVQEIRDNDYDLSINKYKEIVYEQVAYDDPAVILERIEAMESEIQTGIQALKEMLEDVGE